jgi:hypothetical protein
MPGHSIIKLLQFLFLIFHLKIPLFFKAVQEQVCVLESKMELNVCALLKKN